MPLRVQWIRPFILTSVGLVLASMGLVPLGPADASGQMSATPGFSRLIDPDAAIVALLRSSDPREQAWGAWFTGRDHLTQLVPLVQAVVTERVSGFSLNERAAVDVALDALIQLRQTLPSSALRKVSEGRPAQALILATFATSDDVEIDEFLFDVLRANDYSRWFAAANLGLQRKTRGLASTIIGTLRLSVNVRVTSEENSSGWGFGSGRGVGVGCGGGGMAPGLPPWADYRLVTAAFPGLVVLSTGPTTVYYQRNLAPAGSTPAGSVTVREGPTADERLQYLASLAGQVPDSLPVRGTEFREVRLDAGAPLDPALERVRADVLSHWAVLAQALVRAGALSHESAATELPTLDVVVHDSRRPAMPMANR